MYQKDYILRMIEMLGELIRAIFGLITKGDYKTAGQELNEAYLTFLRKDASFFHSIPTENLTTILLEDHNYTHGHLEILAELLHAEALLFDVRGNPEDSLQHYEKSLMLFIFTDENYKTYSAERIEKMERIRKRIAEIKGIQIR